MHAHTHTCTPVHAQMHAKIYPVGKGFSIWLLKLTGARSPQTYWIRNSGTQIWKSDLGIKFSYWKANLEISVSLKTTAIGRHCSVIYIKTENWKKLLNTEPEKVEKQERKGKWWCPVDPESPWQHAAKKAAGNCSQRREEPWKNPRPLLARVINYSDHFTLMDTSSCLKVLQGRSARNPAVSPHRGKKRWT